jgi:hypothetical protein
LTEQAYLPSINSGNLVIAPFSSVTVDFWYGTQGTNSISLRDKISFVPGAGSLVEQRNGANAQTFHIYNSYDAAGVNYERAVLDWTTTPNTFTIGTQAGAPGIARDLQLTAPNILLSQDPTLPLGAATKQYVDSRASGLPLAGSNLAFYAATTGDDNNPGTAALPFRTIQKLIYAATGYDYQSLYYPTMNVALHCGGSLQTAANEDLVIVNNSLYIGDFVSHGRIFVVFPSIFRYWIGHRPLFLVFRLPMDLCEFW